MNKGEVKKIAEQVAATDVRKHEQHMHHGIVPTKLAPHVTVLSHPEGHYTVHHDHTGHEERHEDGSSARASARRMRREGMVPGA